MGAVIVGTGVSLPENVVTNDDLAAVMDTSDEWIQKRTGVVERRLADIGVGSAQLGAEAVVAAIADAGITVDDVDALIAATMTPDHFAPGNAPLIQDRAGLGHVAAYDMRQQCSGFLYGMDMADSLIATDRADAVVVVGSEVHRGYMPYGSNIDVLLGLGDGVISEADYRHATQHRAWSVLFGDAGAAMVFRRGEDGEGITASTLHSDGSLFELIHVPAPGFVHQPWSSAEQIAAGLHEPHMNGGELFRQAVRLMPESLIQVLETQGLTVADLDLVVGHQANQRIIDAVEKRLGTEPGIVATNIAKYGNTTAATLPLLYHELKEEGRVPAGGLVGFTAFGAGAHWGSLLYRAPS